jgi:hypothetical protein
MGDCALDGHLPGSLQEWMAGLPQNQPSRLV